MADRSGLQPLSEATAFQAVEYSHLGTAFWQRVNVQVIPPQKITSRQLAVRNINARLRAAGDGTERELTSAYP